MNETTDCVGFVRVEPALSRRQVDGLKAFLGSRRWDRPEGPYAVSSGRPSADDPRGGRVRRYERPAPGQPSLWCPWRPTGNGGWLVLDGAHDCDRAADWMRYLIKHFLAPGGKAALDGRVDVGAHLVGHALDGAVAYCARESKRMCLIEVRANRVRERVLLGGAMQDPRADPALRESGEYADPPASRRRSSRRRSDGSSGVVIPLRLVR